MTLAAVAFGFALGLCLAAVLAAVLGSQQRRSLVVGVGTALAGVAAVVAGVAAMTGSGFSVVAPWVLPLCGPDSWL